MFTHCPPIELITYERVPINGKRHYRTPFGDFPSITTILGSQDMSWLTEWQNKIGIAEAKRITETSANRGTQLHLLCEYYLNNEPLPTGRLDSLEMFYSIKPILNRITNIHFQEACLYSKILGVAGTVDVIGEFDGILSIIDFKNARRPKTEDKIFDYFLQECFYSIAYNELSGIAIPQIVTIIAVEDNLPQIFIKNIREYIKPLVELKKSFDKKALLFSKSEV